MDTNIMSQLPSIPEVAAGPSLTSPTIPAMLTSQAVLNFNCFPGISCFNACCSKADVTLTPYDVVRLKQRLAISSEQFLKDYTVLFKMDSDGLPGVKMRTTETGACLLLDPHQGCTVYKDRPIVCRYYPLALLNIHEQDTSGAKTGYSIVQEAHCQGHCQPRPISIADYRIEQGCEEYDQYNRDWYHLILKKKSAGPTVGRPSEMSLQLFFMASYNLDMFRRFVQSENFRRNYSLSEGFYQAIANDDLALLDFAWQFLRQVLFGERTIQEAVNAWERRLEERSAIWALRSQAIKNQPQEGGA